LHSVPGKVEKARSATPQSLAKVADGRNHGGLVGVDALDNLESSALQRPRHRQSIVGGALQRLRAVGTIADHESNPRLLYKLSACPLGAWHPWPREHD
jgi:hypothetical protein